MPITPSSSSESPNPYIYFRSYLTDFFSIFKAAAELCFRPQIKVIINYNKIVNSKVINFQFSCIYSTFSSWQGISQKNNSTRINQLVFYIESISLLDLSHIYNFYKHFHLFLYMYCCVQSAHHTMEDGYHKDALTYKFFLCKFTKSLCVMMIRLSFIQIL